MKKILLTGVLFLFVFSSCEMKDAAMQSAQNSGRAADNSDVLLATSKNGYAEGRTAGARKTRRDEIVNLTQDDASLSASIASTEAEIEKLTQELEKAKKANDTVAIEKFTNFIQQTQVWLETLIRGNLSSKLVNATAFMKAFEFQLWKSKEFERDTEARRDELFEVAVNEFFMTLGKFVHTDYNLSVRNPSVGKLNVLAMALTLHTISEHQVRASNEYSFKQESLYSIIAHSLGVRAKVNAGQANYKDQPKFVLEVAQRSELAEYLLQLRYNMMTAQVLKGILPQVVSANWQPALEKHDEAELVHLTELAKGALHVKGVLTQVGLNPILSSDLDVLKLMDTKIQTSQGASEYRVSVENELESLLQELVK